MRPPRIGGFVIHGDAAGTLARCLASLSLVCDEVVALDSGSRDGSADLVRAQGARAVGHPWEGYGSARAAAARAFGPCDYLFFLDSDEWLEPPAVARFRAWREAGPRAPALTVSRRDWADLPGTGRFLFGTERHVRLVTPARATWTPRMIVHEALSDEGAVASGIAVEHDFVRSLERFQAKEERYALLWALQAHAEGRAPKWPPAQALAHTFRLAVLKGAIFRGGRPALALARGFGRYHARKHELLASLRRGEQADLVAMLAGGRLRELLREVEVRTGNDPRVLR